MESDRSEDPVLEEVSDKVSVARRWFEGALAVGAYANSKAPEVQMLLKELKDYF